MIASKEYRLKFDEKARYLVSQMTLAEKAEMMSGHCKLTDSMGAGNYNKIPYGFSGCERLGIPTLYFCDGPRGVLPGNSTCFPVSMASGATFDRDLLYRVGRAIGKEVLACGGNFFGGVCMNIPYNPGAGRSQECFGEDSYHMGEMGTAIMQGVQDEDVIACVKHFALNSMESARFSVSIDADKRTEEEVFFPHFKKVIHAGAASLMSAYNEMVDRDLRFYGKLIRTICPVMKENTYGMVNWGYQLFLKGKWKSDKTDCSFREIPREDGSKMRILVVTPKDKKENSPGFLWIHGGGYSTGVPELDRHYMERFATEGNCVVVSPDYRLSVEAPYPAALEDGYLALKWLKEHAKELDVRDDQLFVGGQSAGGGLATAVTMYARDRKEVAVAFLLAIYPMLDDRFLTESSKNNDAPVWNTGSNRIAWKKYLGDLYGTDKVPMYAAPARCTDFEGLPPVCTFVGSLDPFRDETAELIRNYEKAGIKTHFMIFDGAFHGFDMLAPKSKIGKEAIAFYMDSFHDAIKRYFAPQS